MRSERKEREREEQRVSPRRSRKAKGNTDSKFCKILSIIYSVLMIIFVALLMVLNILPTLMLVLLLIALLVGSIFIVPVLYSPRGKADRKKKMKVVALILVLLLGVANYYLVSTINFLGHISNYIDTGATDRGESHVDVTKETFNVFVSGIDVRGDISEIVSRSDVNMVVTVNPKSREVLITSIPRDYYVELPSYGAMDKLTHAGIYGPEESIAAIENLLDIDINYYAKVNFSTVVSLVDAIGGIDVTTEEAFDTHKTGNIYHFDAGVNHIDGEQALAYCRERQSWIDGDMRRNENQQVVLEAVINKLTKGPVILYKYPAILDAIKGTVETDMNKDDMTDLIKMQLGDMRGWDISKQAIKGTPDFAYCYASDCSASVVMPDTNSVNNAIAAINDVSERE